MQAQIEIRQGWQARVKSKAVALAILVVATLMLIGVGLYARSTNNHASAAPTQVVSVTDQRPCGATQQSQHGNLSGDDCGGTGGEGSHGPTHGPLP